MHFPTRCHCVLFLLSAALVLTAFAGAQSLERRGAGHDPATRAVTPAQPILASEPACK
jgi:hypothetical protein